MDLEKVSQNLKNNIDDYETKDIEKLFMHFSQLILTEYIDSEKNKSEDDYYNTFKETGVARPIIVAYISAKGINPEDVDPYIRSVANNMRGMFPKYEYHVVTVPCMSIDDTVLEVLNPVALEEKERKQFLKKVDELDKIVKKYIDAKGQ